MNTVFALAIAFLLNAQPSQSNTTLVTPTITKIATPSVESIALKAFDAYSKRDLQGFVSLFAENAEVSLFPDKTLLKGRAEIEKSYAHFFQTTPNLSVELVSRQINGNRVIDEMLVTRIAGRKADKSTVLYEIKDGLIVKMCFL